MSNILETIKNEYAGQVARAEIDIIRSLNIGKGNNSIFMREDSLNSLYASDKSFMQSHHQFLKYSVSTMARFVIAKHTIYDYYVKKNCTITSLVKDTEFTRTAVSTVIKDSVSFGWLTHETTSNNAKEKSIFPTNIRLKFWALYCQVRFMHAKNIGIIKSHALLDQLSNYAID